jgi:citrate lyase beta subunit
MPILEAAQVLDPVGRRDLSQACSAHRMVIPCARIGANDLLSLMGGLRRPRGRTIYETPVGKVIDGLIEAFCLSHLPLCAPVYEHFSDVATFKRELKEDVYRGLYSKTAIHPEQIGTIWDCYIPEKVDLEDAIKVTSLNCPPIVSSNGSMLEKACHQRWAKRIMELDRIQRAYLTIDRKYSK